jgi:hypothetical protein
LRSLDRHRAFRGVEFENDTGSNSETSYAVTSSDTADSPKGWNVERAARPPPWSGQVRGGTLLHREPNRALCRSIAGVEMDAQQIPTRPAMLEPADVKRLRQLEHENSRLKKLVADRDLEIDVLKEITRKKW